MLNDVIDISHHNPAASFQEVKNNGIVGVFHKATQGKNVVDAKHHARRRRALDAGLLWGADHFGTKGNVAAQIENFLDTVNPSKTDLRVLDFDPNGESGTMTLTEAEKFVTLVKEKTGRFPGLYSGQVFIREKVGSNTATVLKNCFLRLARYASEKPVAPPAWTTYTLRQYTDGNAGDQPRQVPGIGRCDRDKFNGDEAGLRKFWSVQKPSHIFNDLYGFNSPYRIWQ